MEVTVKYFGQIAEITQKKEETFSYSDGLISEFIEEVYEKYPGLRSVNFKIAQSQQLISTEGKITGEELALLPPFAGG
ncbi:sulfur-carrier protein [Tenacibaculum sp. 190524A05c]|uniref:MoaD/ThiS family protein n=1 Tax=Tenacibaculum platacis TaxID=3137852 RepID=UPI0031FAC988